jgi:16S rRNA processing protein RimM
MTPEPRDPEQGRQPAGSPSSGEPVFLAVGRLRRPHGVKGEILMDVLTDFPERLRRGTRLYIGEQHLPLTIRSARVANQALLVSFHNYDTPEAVGEFRNQVAYVSAAYFFRTGK